MKDSSLLEELTESRNGLKFFHVISVCYVANMMMALTVSARLIPFHLPFLDTNILLTAGTWIIPISFFIQDISTEVYGYEKSRQLVQITMFILVIYIFFLKLTTYFPIPANQFNVDQSYNQIFNLLPRHLTALLFALIVGNLVNDYILSSLKRYYRGKYLPLRFMVATAIGEAALQFTGTTIAWLGKLSMTSEIIPFVMFSYFYKIAFEALMTPFNIVICRLLKNKEGIDVYDRSISYNPFRLRSRG